MILETKRFSFLLTDVIKNEKLWRVREAAVKKITSKKVLKEVSLNDENEYVRNVAKKYTPLHNGSIKEMAIIIARGSVTTVVGRLNLKR